MNPVQAAAILLPVFLVTDWVAVWLCRRTCSRRNLAILIPALLMGVGLATVTTPYTPESALMLATGLIGLWYCARSWFGRAGTAPAEARIGPGDFWGTVAGVTSFIAHSGAPPAEACLLPQRRPNCSLQCKVAAWSRSSRPEGAGFGPRGTAQNSHIG